MGDNRPIGVFDSGIGGLTVLREIHRLAPEESLIYLGDTARVPYGTKSKETVVKYSRNNVRYLIERGVKAIVVACNTASAYAMEDISAGSMPVIGVVEGGVEAAVKISSGKTGVIGTEATISSGAYSKAIAQQKPGLAVRSKPCPLFVPLAEEGWTDNNVAKEVIAEYLSEFKGEIDTLVLACTHYPALKKSIAEYLGPGVKLIDSAEETARKLNEVLTKLNLKADPGAEGIIKVLVTDSPEKGLNVARRMLKDIDIHEMEHVDIFPE